MQTNELVTVIVPMYNAGKTVAKSVKSIQEQTYTNLEILIVNDGSTDNGPEICKKIASEDSRVKIISQKNSGVSVTRNNGIKAASGQWIAFVDSDDMIAPQMIETLLNEAKTYNVGMAICDLRKVNSQDDAYAPDENTSPTTVKITSAEAINRSFNMEIPLFVGGKLIKKELISGDVFPVGLLYEDELACIRMLLPFSEVTFNNSHFFNYVQNTAGITKMPKLKHVYDIIKNQKTIINTLKGKQGIDKKAMYAHLCSNYTLAYNYVFKCSKDKKLYKAIKQKNDRAFKKTDIKSIKCQPNRLSIILLRLNIYKTFLALREMKE